MLIVQLSCSTVLNQMLQQRSNSAPVISALPQTLHSQPGALPKHNVTHTLTITEYHTAIEAYTVNKKRFCINYKTNSQHYRSRVGSFNDDPNNPGGKGRVWEQKLQIDANFGCEIARRCSQNIENFT